MSISYTSIFVDALTISVIGVLTVFSILALLTLVLGLLPRLVCVRRGTGVKAGQVYISKEAGVEVKEKGIGSDEIALVSAAIASFLEYKANVLLRNPLIKQFPALVKLFPAAGISFTARLKLSLGGSEREVEVREEAPGVYTVEIGARKYVASLKPPEEKIEIDLTSLARQ